MRNRFARDVIRPPCKWPLKRIWNTVRLQLIQLGGGGLLLIMSKLKLNYVTKIVLT